MLTKTIWNELRDKWPNRCWDDCMRRSWKGRACIRPEISRTKTYGKVGVSNGQFYDSHLQKIVLSQKSVPFKSKDLSYLVKEKYDPLFLAQVNSSHLVKDLEELGAHSYPSSKLYYRDEGDFNLKASSIGAMGDFKDKIPRNGYKGIVPTMYKGRRLFLVPASETSTKEIFLEHL